jgi:hypothetical protein
MTRDEWELDTVTPVGKRLGECTSDDLRRCIELLRAQEAQLLREAQGDAR